MSRSQCWWCGSDLIWDGDFDDEEHPGEIETFLHCPSCGACVRYFKEE